MTGLPRRSRVTERALSAAVAVAARHGLRCEAPIVLKDAGNLLVRLAPAPVVARVMTVGAALGDGVARLAREVAIATHLVAAGAPVVAPSTEIAPGPHAHDGLVMTLWTFVDEADRVLDAREAGRALAVCHEALTSYAGAPAPISGLDAARADVELLAATGALGDADAAMLRRAGEDARARIDRIRLPSQAIHGDAHLGNVVMGPDGPLWNDWEDAFDGPRVWDLGCLRADAIAFGRDPGPGLLALDGYATDLDDAVLGTFVAARRLQGTVWVARLAADRSDRREQAEALLAYYRERDRRD